MADLEAQQLQAQLDLQAEMAKQDAERLKLMQLAQMNAVNATITERPFEAINLQERG